MDAEDVRGNARSSPSGHAFCQALPRAVGRGWLVTGWGFGGNIDKHLERTGVVIADAVVPLLQLGRSG